jgi:hypothetical protein
VADASTNNWWRAELLYALRYVQRSGVEPADKMPGGYVLGDANGQVYSRALVSG